MNSAIIPEKLSKNFTVTAHTGCLNTPDNTVESIIAGINCGADIFEIDLNFDDNGIPVLSHNTPEGNDNLLFDDALKVISDNKTIRINIDVKKTIDLAEMERIAVKYGFGERAFMTGIEERFVPAVLESCRTLTHYLNLNVKEDTDADEVVKKVKETQSIGLNTEHCFITQEIIDKVHEIGLLVSVWTVNNEEDMIKYINMGVDNITTKKPDILLELIK